MRLRPLRGGANGGQGTNRKSPRGLHLKGEVKGTVCPTNEVGTSRERGPKEVRVTDRKGGRKGMGGKGM